MDFAQQTLTVTFSEILTGACLKSLAALARSGAASLRNMRVTQTITHPEDLPHILKTALPDLCVPEDPGQAAAILSNLYDNGANEIISAAFGKFAAVLRYDHDVMIFCHMSEINLGMAGKSDNAERIVDGISYLESKLDAGCYHAGGLHYSIGNGLSTLGREEEEAKAYEKALEHLSDEIDTLLLAMCHKNLGSSYEKLGDSEKAVKFFRMALCLSPELPEAHAALGLHCLRNGEYGVALKHFDQVVFTEQTLGKRSSVSGWRINVLFNLGDANAAFREINTLLSDAKDEAWIWPWCARQVPSFGRAHH